MREGDVIAGRYRILRRAGSGGMGAVYEAHDAVRDVSVALKTLRIDSEPRPSRASEGARLVREGAALAEVRHPAVVSYVDHGIGDDGEPFLVMAWVAGDSLQTRLRSGGVSPADALGLAARLAAGLSAAHARGVIHRDLKPANVMLAADDVDQAVIVDFGVARVARAGAELTATGDHVGTLRYMAPEQIRSARSVDSRADVFSLGCILFESLVGRPCFPGADPVTVLARILFEALPVPSAVRADLPHALDELVAALLIRDASRRPDAATAERLVRNALADQRRSIERLPVPPATEVADDAAPLSLRTVSLGSSSDAAPPSFQLGATAIVTAAHRALPPQQGRFFGREAESRQLAALLRVGTPMVTVWGGAGIGKTRLAVEVVRRIAAEDAPPWDALVYGDLREARDADDVVRIVAREAGVSLESRVAPEVALGRALGKLGRVLLVVEPIEHVSALIATLVVTVGRASPRLQLLATSRRRVCPPGGVAFEVGPLPTAPDSAGPSPAARLLLARCGLGPSNADPGIVDRSLLERCERLAEALEGIPLAIELAASSVPILGLDGILARLRAQSDAGTDSLATVTGPMRRVLDWSWQLLTEAERGALAQCAVFRGSFTAHAAEAIAQTSDAEVPTIALLQSLRDHSLLRSWAHDSTNEARLSMFAAVHEFASEKLQSSPDLRGALRRHAAYYADTGEGARQAPTTQTLARIEQDADNLFAAAEFSLGEEEGDVVAGMRSLLALEPAVFLRGALSSYEALLDRALARVEGHALDDQASSLAMRIRQTRARLDAPAGRTQRALADLAICLDDARRRGDAYREGTILLDEGVVHHLERAWGDARRCYESALECLGRPGVPEDFYARGRCIGNLGALAHDERNLPEAARFYRQAMALFEPSGDVRRRAHVMGNLALLEHELGHTGESLRLYEQAIALLEPIRDARVLAITLGNLGVLKLELGEAARAVELHERSHALLAGSGDARSRALCAARLAAGLALLDRIAEAEVRLTQAERIALEADATAVEAVALTRAFVELAWAEEGIATGTFDRARESLAVARQRIERVANAHGGAAALVDQSDDIRSTLRILRPILQRTEARLRSADAQETG
jgi:serine/threonine protein kinase/predicted ATPase